MKRAVFLSKTPSISGIHLNFFAISFFIHLVLLSFFSFSEHSPFVAQKEIELHLYENHFSTRLPSFTPQQMKAQASTVFKPEAAEQGTSSKVTEVASLSHEANKQEKTPSPIDKIAEQISLSLPSSHVISEKTTSPQPITKISDLNANTKLSQAQSPVLMRDNASAILAKKAPINLIIFEDYQKADDGVYEIVALEHTSNKDSLANLEALQNKSSNETKIGLLSNQKQQGILPHSSLKQSQYDGQYVIIGHQNQDKEESVIVIENDVKTRQDSTRAELSALATQKLLQEKDTQKIKGQNLDPYEFAISSYIGILFKVISTAHHYPEEAKQQGLTGETIIRFTINPDGALDEVDIIKSSGFDILDKAALKTIRNAAPFASLPKEIGQKQLTFRLPMRFDTQ